MAAEMTQAPKITNAQVKGKAMSITRRKVSIWLILFAVGCGSTEPDSPYPDVAGSYAGTLTLALAGAGNLNGSMTMDVVQSNDQLTITGSLTFLGETTDLPAITGTINETGFFTATAGGFSGSTSDPECGTWTTTSATLTFSGATARLQESATSPRCGTLTISGTLNRR